MRRFFELMAVVLMATASSGCVLSFFSLKTPLPTAVDPDGKVDRVFSRGDVDIFVRSRTACAPGSTMNSVLMWVAILNKQPKDIDVDPGEFFIQFAQDRVYHVTRNNTTVSGGPEWFTQIYRRQTIPSGVRTKGLLVFPGCHQEPFVLNVMGQAFQYE